MPAAKQDNNEAQVIKVIDIMSEPDRSIAKRLHDIITSSAPSLMPRTWYGMPAYTNGNKVVCFFRSRDKFGERYMTLGFNDVAKLDDGNLWPIAFALKKLTPKEEAEISALIKKAVS